MINKVKEKREFKNITQEDLATQVGISRFYLYRIEKCLANPSHNIITDICNALDEKVEDVFFIENVN